MKVKIIDGLGICEGIALLSDDLKITLSDFSDIEIYAEASSDNRLKIEVSDKKAKIIVL